MPTDCHPHFVEALDCWVWVRDSVDHSGEYSDAANLPDHLFDDLPDRTFRDVAAYPTEAAAMRAVSVAMLTEARYSLLESA